MSIVTNRPALASIEGSVFLLARDITPESAARITTKDDTFYPKVALIDGDTLAESIEKITAALQQCQAIALANPALEWDLKAIHDQLFLARTPLNVAVNS